MFEVIKRKLSIKVAVALTLFTLPPMILAAYVITSREGEHLEQLTLDRGKDIAVSGARMYGEALEAEIDRGTITVADVFDPVYEEIKGYDFGEHPRFHTKYDYFTDRETLGFEDSFVDSNPDILYAVGVDMNGYIPTHNSRATLPLTGDRDNDRTHYRSKRKFANPVELAGARNIEPVLVQSYARDTGEHAWDVAAPIYVKGRHFGGFRVGVSISSIVAHEHALLVRLSTVFGVLALIIVGFIFIMLRRAMKPLERLSGLADQISMGEGLDQPIKTETSDEVGQMATSLNRLRASLKLTMSRLGE